MKKVYFLTLVFFILANISKGQFANTSLSNLTSPTAINHSLTPRITSAFNFGSPFKKWKNLYLSGGVYTDSIRMAFGGINVSTTGIISASGNTTTAIEGSGDAVGVVGTGSFGVQGFGNFGVYGRSNDDASGVWGDGSYSGIGARGMSYAGEGVYGSSTEGLGGSFYSDSYWGLKAETGSGDYAGAFYGDVYTTGSYLPSDGNLKKNVQEVHNAMEIVERLSPRYYQYTEDAQYAAIHLPKGNHYGLLAQDVEKILPGLVKTSLHVMRKRRNVKASQFTNPQSIEAALAAEKLEKDAPKESFTLKAVNYTELIPVLVKAIQELNAEKDKQVGALQSQIDELKLMILKDGNNRPILTLKGYLKQNIPNPANDQTIIRYHVADNISKAQIRITDAKGVTVKVYPGLQGEGLIKVKRNDLPAGTYTYTLSVNNEKVDSKKMIVTRD